MFGTDIEAYQGSGPPMDIRDYFNGPIRAWGLVQSRGGKVLQRFDVDMHGSWDGNEGTLEEEFSYYDGTSDTRTWKLKCDESGDAFTGKAGDVVGKAEGDTSGFAANWTYRFELDIDGRTFVFRMDDWLYRMNDGVLINIADMKKFGFRVARLTLFMQKQDTTNGQAGQ